MWSSLFEPRWLLGAPPVGSADSRLILILSDLAVVTESPDRDNEHRERLREGFGFSRSFIVTYQAALLIVVLVASLVHHSERWRRWQRSRRLRPSPEHSVEHHRASSQPDGWESSSSTSTYNGTATPPPPSKQHSHEATPLLQRDARSPRRSMLSVTRSLLMYQPPRIPILGQEPPALSTIFLVLFLLGLNFFYLLFRAADQSDVLSDRAGLLFAANLPWLYLLAAKNQPIKFLTGDSYECLNLLHRRLGEFMCALAALHFAGMLLAWYEFLAPRGFSLGRFLTLPYILWGVVAFTLYEALYFTSIINFRDWWYEVFLGSHILFQAGGLVFLFLHHYNSRPYTAASLAIFITDRAVYRLLLKTECLNADLRILDDGNTVLVSADWPLISRWNKLSPAILRSSLKYGWQPAEHCFISVPELGRKHVIQFHPFTIASAAPSTGTSHAWFNLLIRSRDGFSRDLLTYAQDHTSAQVRVDGPYGSLHALRMLQGSDISVLVAGGSGIAVAYPLVWALLNEPHPDSEASIPSKRVYLVWVIHEADHVSWLGQERLDELKARGLEILIPPPTMENGRPDMELILTNAIYGLGYDAADRTNVGVMVSGPDSLNKSVRNLCSRLVWQGLDIDVAVEKFGW